MAHYSIGWTKAFSAASGLLAQLRTGASRDARIFEIGVFQNSATAAAVTILLNRPTAVGATFTSTGTGQPMDNVSGAGVAVVDTAATTAPTFAANDMRQFAVPATNGAGVIWTFPEGIVVPISSAIALRTTASSTTTWVGYFHYDE